MAFLVIFWLGLGTPAILRQNPNKLSFGQFRKKVGIGSDPRPPPWAKFPTFTENLFCKLPLHTARAQPPLRHVQCCIQHMQYAVHIVHSAVGLPTRALQPKLACRHSRPLLLVHFGHRRELDLPTWACSRLLPLWQHHTIDYVAFK